jgi:hypothetical protein
LILTLTLIKNRPKRSLDGMPSSEDFAGSESLVRTR